MTHKLTDDEVNEKSFNATKGFISSKGMWGNAEVKDMIHLICDAGSWEERFNIPQPSTSQQNFLSVIMGMALGKVTKLNYELSEAPHDMTAEVLALAATAFTSGFLSALDIDTSDMEKIYARFDQH